MAVTLMVKKVKTAPLKIQLLVPGVLNGYFTGHAKIRSKPDIKMLSDRIENGEFTENGDELLARELYEGFNGIPDIDSGKELEGEDAWDALLNGPISSYLSPAAVTAYFAQYGEARQGNSGRRR
jgi:hypothetical protein